MRTHARTHATPAAHLEPPLPCRALPSGSPALPGPAQGYLVNLIDSPGHVDFCSEVRSLRMDAVYTSAHVLCVSMYA